MGDEWERTPNWQAIVLNRPPWRKKIKVYGDRRLAIGLDWEWLYAEEEDLRPSAKRRKT